MVSLQQDDDVLEGLLRCPTAACRHEFPIIDGIPVIVPQLREYLRGWSERIRSRDSFTEPVESLLGDCCGAGTSFEDERQRLSSYAWDHWGDCDSAEHRDATDSVSPGSIVRLLNAGLSAFAPQLMVPDGPVLDVGCAVGRTTHELERVFERPVLGIDLDLSMLRFARRVRDTGIVEYPRRRVGLAYDRRRFDVAGKITASARARVDYWCCDATVLPFVEERFSFVSSLNLLDCVASPLAHLREIARSLLPTGLGVIASPYDWAAAATPVEGWLGGHSQRGETAGSSEQLVRDLLTAGRHPAAIEGIQIVAEQAAVPWCVRMHERAIMHYRSHMLVVKKQVI